MPELDLNEIRKEIDAVDEQIVALYEQRMKLSEQVADYKIANGKPVFDRAREKAKIAKVRSLSTSEFNRTGVEELYQQLMSMSRKLQYQKLTAAGATGSLPFIPLDNLPMDHIRVVYQGVEGAYSEMALMQYFGEDANRFHVPSFRDAMMTIADGAADYAVLPIENSTAGIVTQNYDMLSEFENYIVGDIELKIEHCLLGLPGTHIKDIDSVYSHAQGLMQCSSYLDDHRHMDRYQTKNTAMAAQKVADDGLKNQAAIASRASAKIYGLEILAENISLSSENVTRFIIVTNQRIFKKDARKISITFQVPHERGSLYRLLSHFIYNGLNMSKIESRPVPDRMWEYQFFVDFDGNLSESSVKNAIRGIREEAKNLRILGNY